MEQKLVHVFTVIDGTSEELVDLIEIKAFDLKAFAEQFDADLKTDPEMRERYSVGPDDVTFLEKTLERELPLDFKRFAYFIEAATKD
jgi:hypothetical protein